MAKAYRSEVIPVMDALREAVDKSGRLSHRLEKWPVPAYSDIIFNV